MLGSHPRHQRASQAEAHFAIHEPGEDAHCGLCSLERRSVRVLDPGDVASRAIGELQDT